MTGLTNPNGQLDSFFLILTPHLGAYMTGLTNPNSQSDRFFFNHHHLVLRSAVNSVMFNFVTHVYLLGLTLGCQLNKAQFIHQTWSPSSSHLEKSCFTSTAFSRPSFFDALYVVPNSTFSFSLPQSCRLSPFIFPYFQQNAEWKCYAPTMQMKYRDRSYQRDMQTLCPVMLIINSELLTWMSIFYECKQNVMQV